jgi:hypothetical protein
MCMSMPEAPAFTPLVYFSACFYFLSGYCVFGVFLPGGGKAAGGGGAASTHAQLATMATMNALMQHDAGTAQDKVHVWSRSMTHRTIDPPTYCDPPVIFPMWPLEGFDLLLCHRKIDPRIYCGPLEGINLFSSKNCDFSPTVYLVMRASSPLCFFFGIFDPSVSHTVARSRVARRRGLSLSRARTGISFPALCCTTAHHFHFCYQTRRIGTFFSCLD